MQACKNYGLIFRRPRGLFLSMKDRGRVREVMNNWPSPSVQHIVVTDGENVLGQGDLGIQGMAIAVRHTKNHKRSHKTRILK
jgi:malate dehydrogenase (oxaloacetate-decarboxylating)(NADP+)